MKFHVKCFKWIGHNILSIYPFKNEQSQLFVPHTHIQKVRNIERERKKRRRLKTEVMRPHMDNINSFGYTSAARPTWETARPQPPPRRRANSLQPTSTVASTNTRPTRRSLFNTTVVWAPFYISCIFFCFQFNLVQCKSNYQEKQKKKSEQ